RWVSSKVLYSTAVFNASLQNVSKGRLPYRLSLALQAPSHLSTTRVCIQKRSAALQLTDPDIKATQKGMSKSCQSTLAPDALTTFSHLARSLSMNSENCCGFISEG